MGQKLLDFGDLTHLQGHTSTLSVKFWQKSLSALDLFNQIMDSGQTLHIVSLG